MQKRIGLYWFTNDLRLTDNPLLHKASEEVDQLICLYSKPQFNCFLQKYSCQERWGAARTRFLNQSLRNLSQSLDEFGQRLIVVDEPTIGALCDLVLKHEVSDLYCNQFAGFDEQTVIEQLGQNFTDLIIHQSSSNHLYSEEQLPFELSGLPNTFTKFRKLVEGISLRELMEIPRLPPPVKNVGRGIQVPAEKQTQSVEFLGGEAFGMEHCLRYFSTKRASEYKLTRNGLDGPSYSTKFSPWLAHGCISPRQVLEVLRDYEQKNGANESTYWIFFELLWREFFYWYARRWGKNLFLYSGIKNCSKLAAKGTFASTDFSNWVEGKTDFPIVNACMNQLRKTGFMSNRGRQLVASCLIHELGIDWRYGAAYFETQLIDYDVGSNWGNWQYLAGVGADTQPARQFNLGKQTEIYDPKREFIMQWADVGSEKESLQ